ncbi:MAG TPA: discoidin domain-containing protein, partial [Bacillota bacterium]|nr:discoidin domain-containing protein [Bacillota bacterium]
RGLNSIFNAAWQGHAQKEYRILVLDLGATYEIDRVEMGFIQDQPSNVWVPNSLSLAVSDDGINWQVVTKRSTKACLRKTKQLSVPSPLIKLQVGTWQCFSV